MAYGAIRHVPLARRYTLYAYAKRHPEVAMIVHRSWSFALPAEFGHRDVTPEVAALVAEVGVTTGLVTVQLVGSTGAVTTIEYESGALADLRRALDQIAPVTAPYEHNQRWGDGNGFSHVRSALLKTSVGIPVVSGALGLGTWQQIVVLNLDNRKRTREVVAVVVGE
jgi:secondary thiamine-phosphate synthase enzyme